MSESVLVAPSRDPISDVLKWVLLGVAVLCFSLLGWATARTYRDAPPLPQRSSMRPAPH